MAAIGSAPDLDHSECQRLKQLPRRSRIALLRRNQECRGLGARDGPLAYAIEVPQQVLAMNRRLVQARLERDRLVIDDVSQAPLAALPRLEKIPASLARVVAQGVRVELVGANRHRRRELHAGRFGQNPQPAVERLVVPRRRPEIVDRMNRDALLAGRGQVRRHGRADHVHFLRQNRVDVRLDRIEPRRHEHARRIYGSCWCTS